MQEVAERAEKVRDLKKQIGELAGQPDSEIVFIENSPRRNKVTLYSMLNGEPVNVPEYMVTAAINKSLPDGTPMFTGDKDKAPTWEPGTTRCFLHTESVERGSGLLKAVGLEAKLCPAGNLAGEYAKGEHARHRHSKEWAAMEAHITNEKEREQVERQERQLEATLALAGKAASAPVETVEECPVEGCGYTGTKNQIRGHKMGSHK